jgi:inner membrane protein
VPSVFTHAVAAAAIGAAIIPGRGRLIGLGAVCAVLPDADVVAFLLDVPYAAMFGHRGLSHSIPFAAALAVALAWLLRRNGEHDGQVGAVGLGAFLFLATASHGLLDALTDGGLGVAFLAPLSDARYFFPWRPIAVSPISARRFFSSEGVPVIASEIAVVWIPAALVFGAAVLLRRRRRAPREHG